MKMVYKLNENLYKKLVSDNDKHFESLLYLNGVPNSIRDDEKVVRKINNQFNLKGTATDISIKREVAHA